MMRSKSTLAVLTGVSLVLGANPAFADGPSTAPSTSSSAAPAAAAAPPADGKVEVHIKTKGEGTLQYRESATAPWVTACDAPCDTRLSTHDEYRMVGTGFYDGQPFRLGDGKDGVVRLHFRPGIKKRETVGEVLTITGGAMVLGAIIGGAIAANPSSVFNANGTTNDYNFNVIAVATAVGAVGLGVLIFGGAWWHDNASSEIRGDIQPVPEPQYQTGMRTTAPLTPTYVAPLFTTSF